MNLFWKNLFGGIASTATLEKKEKELTETIKRYAEIEKSMELAEYLDLKKTVQSPGFKEKKKTLLNRKYKDTEEYRDYAKFQKIANKDSFKLYLETLQSSALSSFLEFQKTEQYMLLSDKKAVQASETLQHMRKYEHSKEYQNYLRYHDSFIEKEYTKLNEIVSTEDFKKREAFWRNPKRWETTDEFKMDSRYQLLKKNEDIIFYRKTDPATFQQYKSHKVTFLENFDWNTLDASRWDFGFHYANDKLIENHSFANEKQANNNGQNVSVVEGQLHLETKHEKVTAPAWDVKKGFINKEFEYTSDVMQTAKTFRQKQGIFRAKLRCQGNIHHAFWLGGDKKLPLVNIFHYDGKNITVGNANAQVFDEVKISGLNPSKYYIYSLAWTPKELIWYINDLEVFRTSANLPAESLYMAFNSFISEKQKGTTGLLEIDWVKVYTTE